MIFNVRANTAPQALRELLIKMPMYAVKRDSRNGKVYTIPDLSVLEIEDPTARVIFDPIRDANPFFHVMEAVWMFAGEDDVSFPAMFVPSYADYAEKDDTVHGAYGHRWQYQFGFNQILQAVRLLQKDPGDRQVVIQMWSAISDMGAKVYDKPCNTHIYLRADMGKLDMTVCNRSNDAIWGMLGANVVHMTMLQELISIATQIPIGMYRVVSNNLHIYPDKVKNFSQLWTSPNHSDHYQPDRWDEGYVTPDPILLNKEKLLDFLFACKEFIHDPDKAYGFYFLDTVARPMYRAWCDKSIEACDNIVATDWRLACKEWLQRRQE